MIPSSHGIDNISIKPENVRKGCLYTLSSHSFSNIDGSFTDILPCYQSCNKIQWRAKQLLHLSHIKKQTKNPLEEFIVNKLTGSTAAFVTDSINCATSRCGCVLAHCLEDKQRWSSHWRSCRFKFTFRCVGAIYTVAWHSVRLHAQLSRITLAIVRLCYPSDNCNCSSIHAGEKIGSLDGSCHSPVWWVALHPFQQVVTEPPPADLFTSQAATNCLGIRERWCTKSETKLHLCTFHIWCTW